MISKECELRGCKGPLAHVLSSDGALFEWPQTGDNGLYEPKTKVAKVPTLKPWPRKVGRAAEETKAVGIRQQENMTIR